ncbi:SPRY domain protein [Aspergillus lentulus]|nr:SPRY domain protein [Aspergillus lentulus]
MQSTRDNDRDIRRYDDSEFVAANRVTPLKEAVREGRTDIVHVLLKNALPAMVQQQEINKGERSGGTAPGPTRRPVQVSKGVIKARSREWKKREGSDGAALGALGALGAPDSIEDHELQTASWKGDIENVEQLLANGASAASTNRCGWAPLHAASWNGDIQVVRLLLGKGAHPTAESNIGWTPLDAAFASGRVDTVRLLSAT